MLVSPVDSAPENTLSALRSRSPKRAGHLGIGRVKDGLTIGSLRATSGPPGGGLLSGNSTGVRQGGGTSLLDASENGQGLIAQLRSQVGSHSPLKAGMFGGGQKSGPLSMGVLQARQSQMQRGFQRIDGQSRFLQASGNPLRQKSGFQPRLFTSTLSLVG